MSTFKILFSLLVLYIFSAPVFSRDGTERGVISTIEVTHESNYAFRVTLKGQPTLCGNQHTWAFLNKADSNYDTYVSLLTAAKFAEVDVAIYTNRQASGYCKIGYIAVY